MPKLVALAMPGGPAFVSALQRVWDSGDAVLPVDLRLPPTARTALLDALAPSVVIDDSGESHARSGGRPVADGDALVLATSGTTGEPKGVVLTHDAVAASAEITSEALGVTDNDSWIACLPVAHIGGLSVITRALITNTRLTALPSFEAEVVESYARAGATLISLVNTALKRIDPTLFRRILLGGSAPLKDRPSHVIATYGMTETASGIVYEHWPLRGVELKVRPENNELLVRSPTLLRCYRDGSDPRDVNGWFATGDAGSVRADGYLDVFGRISEVINTGGEKVWPSALERVLRTHPSIAEVLVAGAPDDEWGERVVATVEVLDGKTAPSLEELRDFTRTTLPAYCAPRSLNVVASLPRTASGKVRRTG